MKRTASAAWTGDLKQGKGSVSTQSGVLKDTQYSFATRFENGIGTNPEELIAAAHAGCFTMATSAAISWNFLASMPGTFAVICRSTVVMVQLPDTCSSVRLALVESLSGVKPARPSAAAVAIVKHPACAAAISSSGLVPTPFSNRVVNE